MTSKEPVRRFRDEPLTTVYRRWICQTCGGEMIRTHGGIALTRPPQYPHRCAGCGNEEMANMSYPRIAYLPIEAIEKE